MQRALETKLGGVHSRTRAAPTRKEEEGGDVTRWTETRRKEEEEGEGRRGGRTRKERRKEEGKDTKDPRRKIFFIYVDDKYMYLSAL